MYGDFLNLTGMDFFAGVIASIVAAFLWDRFSSKFPTSSKFGSIDVRGIWIGKVPYSFRSERQGYNIYKIHECRGNIKSYIEHHSKADNGANKSVKLFGVGVFNDPVLSIAYQFDRTFIKQSGVFIGRIQSIGMIGDVIQASYSQYVEDSKGTEVTIKLITEEYTLYKIRLPIKNQMRVLFGLKYFPNIVEMESFFIAELKKRNITKP